MTAELEVGSVRIWIGDDGYARLRVGEDDSSLITWSRSRFGHSSTFGEELARALAIVDGNFEVRRFDERRRLY